MKDGNPGARAGSARDEVPRIVAWYVERAYGRWEGPTTVPYYCDPARVGYFAVRPSDLAAGKEAALFRLFLAMAMFQARRDVVIMAQQRAMPRAEASALTSPSKLRRLVQRSACEHLSSAAVFDEHCSVRKTRGAYRSHRGPGALLSLYPSAIHRTR